MRRCTKTTIPNSWRDWDIGILTNTITNCCNSPRKHSKQAWLNLTRIRSRSWLSSSSRSRNSSRRSVKRRRERPSSVTCSPNNAIERAADQASIAKTALAWLTLSNKCWDLTLAPNSVWSKKPVRIKSLMKNCLEIIAHHNWMLHSPTDPVQWRIPVPSWPAHARPPNSSCASECITDLSWSRSMRCFEFSKGISNTNVLTS